MGTLVAFGAAAILILLSGYDPILVYSSIISGSLSSTNAIAETLVKATPYLFCALTASIAFKVGFWNAGAEGQFFMGSLGAVIIGLYLQSPSIVTIPIMIATAFLAGAAWGMIPTFLKVKLGVNEILTNIMSNYIAYYLISYVSEGPLRDPRAVNPQTPFIGYSAYLPKLIPGTRLHAGFLIALLCAVLLYVVYFKTLLGYRMRVIGANPEAARYGGISVPRTIIIIMIISGGLAGLGGMSQVAGVHHRLSEQISGGPLGGYGFMAMVIALFGKLHPIGAVASSIFWAVMINGVETAQRGAGIPFGLVYVIQALVVIFVIVVEIFVRARGRK